MAGQHEFSHSAGPPDRHSGGLKLTSFNPAVCAGFNGSD